MCTTEVLHQSGGVDQYRDCTFKGGGTSEIRFDIVFGVIKVDGDDTTGSRCALVYG